MTNFLMLNLLLMNLMMSLVGMNFECFMVTFFTLNGVNLLVVVLFHSSVSLAFSFFNRAYACIGL